MEREAALLTVAVVLAACGNMSGLDGSTEYGCKAPDGVRCNSVSGNYYNAIQNNLPSQRQTRDSGSPRDKLQPEKSGNDTPASVQHLPGPAHVPASLRTQGRVLRLWTKPWEDADGDLHDQGYVYLQIDHGRWQIDHTRQQIRDAYPLIRPPRVSTPPATQSGSGSPTPTAATNAPQDKSAVPNLTQTIESLRGHSQPGAADEDR
jgi:conjugal transfer pilus assembly protein TraV